jgi:beta-1,4-mannosyltransferase
MPPVALLAVTALFLFLIFGLQLLLLPDLRAALLAATGALRSAVGPFRFAAGWLRTRAGTIRSAAGASRRGSRGPSPPRVVVSVDGPYDEANPHLKQVYESMRASSDAIEFRPLHLRRSLAEAFRGAWFSGHESGVSRVIHIHYPLFLYEGSTLLAAVLRGLRSGVLLLALRLGGHRIVCTLHDGAAHDFPFRRWERAFLTILTQAADRVTTMSEAGQRLLFEEFGRAGYIHVARHCVYDVPAFSPERRRRWRAEHGAGEEETIMLLFGTVKAYKGFVDVMDACAELCTSLEGRPLTLICAGRGMRELTGGMAIPGLRLITMDHFIGEEERTELMDAADFGVLPYRHILHSGTAMLFASHCCPVIAPRTGVFEEHERDFRIGLYYEPADHDDLRRTFVEAVILGRRAFAGYFADFHAAHRRSDEVHTFLELYTEFSGEEMFPEGGNLKDR